MPFAKLGLAPDELGHDPESPMANGFISSKVVRVRQRPQMEMAALSGEFRDREIPQFIQLDCLVWQSRAEDRPGRIDDDAAHPVSGCGELDQIVYAPTDDPFLVIRCGLSPLG